MSYSFWAFSSFLAANVMALRPLIKCQSRTVTMRSEDNDFLPWDASSFADPIVNPAKTIELSLQEVERPSGSLAGSTKEGCFHELLLDGVKVPVVVKWFNRKEDVDRDFLSQGFANLVSSLYSKARNDGEKIYFLQPLLVSGGSTAVSRIQQFGLLERRLGRFARQISPSDERHAVFDKFQLWMGKGRLGGWIKIGDPQGWYRGEKGNLFMTDAALSYSQRSVKEKNRGAQQTYTGVKSIIRAADIKPGAATLREMIGDANYIEIIKTLNAY